MALTVTIAGVDATERVAVNSLRLNDRLNTRSRLSLTLHDTPFTLTTEAGEVLTTETSDPLVSSFAYPQIGSVITLTEAETLAQEDGDPLLTEAGDLLQEESRLLFGGFIDSLSEELTLDGNLESLTIDLECVSYDAIADRHLVAARYDASPQDLSDIVDDIITNVLTGEGVTASYGSPLPAIGKIQWNYSTAAAVFDDLASLTGWAWWIDPNKVLQFQPRSAIAAPFTIGPDNARKVRVSRTTEVYRNRQLIRAGKGLTVSRTENFTGDGTRKTFTLAYPVGSGPTDNVPPTIAVGGVGKSVGIRGVAPAGSTDWLYNVDDANVSQDDGAAAVGAGVTIAVTYRGQYPILIQSQDDAEISSQAALGGGAGIFEAIDERAALNTIEGAQDAAAGLLRRFGKIPRRVTFETDTSGLRAGQLLTMAFAPHNVSGSWLIDVVSASDRNGNELVWTVEALDGESIGGWETFFSELAKAGRVIEFRENEVVVLLRAPSETVTFTDSTTYSSAAPESRVGFALVGFSEVGT